MDVARRIGGSGGGSWTACPTSAGVASAVVAGLVAGILLVGGPAPAATGSPGHVPAPSGSPRVHGLPSSSFFLARGDPRLCPSPMCGGLFVHLVNRSRTTCGDGGRRPACYVARADLSRLGLSDATRIRLESVVAAGRALVRGTVVRGRVPGFPELDTLVASEVWPASSAPRAPTGVFRRVSDNHVRCVVAPCFSTDATALNRGGTVTLSGVGLAGVGATAAERARALAAVARGRLTVAGRIVAVPKAGPAGTGR